MNSLLVIIIVLIILLSIYLYLRYKQNNSIFESFDNTQSALSTYFQNTVDADTYVGNNSFNNNDKMLSNSLTTNPTISANLWNGIWENKSLYIYAQFIQNNDKLIISFSNESFAISSASYASSITSSASANGCINNLFTGIGQLNNSRNIFNLTSVKCNTYINSGLNLIPYQLSGSINGDIITLYSNGIAMTTTLNRVKSFTNTNPNTYLQTISPNINQNPVLPDSEIIYEESLCSDNTEPCLDNNNGLATTTYKNVPVNACGKKTSETDNTCSTTSCVFYTPNNTNQGLTTCTPQQNKIYDYMNFIPISLQTNYTGNNLDICNYLKYFSINTNNSCIICYVSNIGNVQTLNYQFFGSKPSESALTTQYDMMNQSLNKPQFLPSFRSAINGNNSPDFIINQTLSFTNCIENNTAPGNTQTQKQTCINTCKQYIKSYVPSVSNNSLVPSVWQITPSTTKNTLNSCSFILSTSSNYNTPVKHAEFNSDGTINLSLFSGGTKQELVLESANIIKENDTGNNSSVVITANIKTNDNLYLVPSIDNNGFSNNSNLVKLSKTPESNGKWLILGFTLNNLNNLVNQINNMY
jgi:hypothetical protein